MGKDFKEVLSEIKSGVIKKTDQIEHVAYYVLDKTPYSFHLYAVYERNDKDVLTEFFYDLRYKKFYIHRNGKEVNFSVANLDTIIPRKMDGWRTKFNCDDSVRQFFEMVSVEENKGMYRAMINAIGSIGAEKVNMSSRALIRLITTYNKLELLYKAGVDISAVRNDTFRQYVHAAGEKDVKKVHEIFGLTRAQYKFLLEFTSALPLLAENARYARYLQPEDMDKYRGYIKLIAELEEKYNVDNKLQVFLGRTSVVKYVDSVFKKRYIVNGESYGAYDDSNLYGFIYKYNHTNPAKLIEYLLFECDVSQGMDFSTAFTQYRDYYSMCIDMEYERFERYPHYLKTKHDIVARNYKAVSDEMTKKKFTEATARHRELETTIGDYSIVVPERCEELITEGNVLHHCVAGYIKKVVEGKSLIVFLREKEKKDEPLVTVEIRDKKIVQVRGQGNRAPSSDEKEFVRKFAKRKSLKYGAAV